jgi:hypothetical protein
VYVAVTWTVLQLWEEAVVVKALQMRCVVMICCVLAVVVQAIVCGRIVLMSVAPTDPVMAAIAAMITITTLHLLEQLIGEDGDRQSHQDHFLNLPSFETEAIITTTVMTKKYHYWKHKDMKNSKTQEPLSWSALRIYDDFCSFIYYSIIN